MAETTGPFGLELVEERPLTVDDLAMMPDDSRRYELLDGSLLVTPRRGTGTSASYCRWGHCWRTRALMS